MASGIYNEFKKEIFTIDWENNVIKVMLVDNTYVFDETAKDTHLNKSDIDALGDELPTANGYTAGGQTLTGTLVTVDITNNISKAAADNVIWSSSTITARGAIVYFDTTIASTSTLIAYIDFLADKSSSAGDFVIQWHTDGVFKLG